MKREYKQPSARFIDYSYDEQVVAESSKIDGKGDGFQLHYCTWDSAAFANPCTSVLSKADKEAAIRCFDITPWSLR